VWPDEELTTDYYVLSVGDTRSEATALARDLRALGDDVVVEQDVSGRSFGAQLGYADSINAETVVVVGERDLENGEYTVKDMASGDETTVPVEEFPPEGERSSRPTRTTSSAPARQSASPTAGRPASTIFNHTVGPWRRWSRP